MILNGNNKSEVIEALIERDGLTCQYPDCTLDFSPIPDHKLSITVDHIHPQARGRMEGWTEDQINDLTNLQLMHKSCNAKKSDLVYNEDGTLPVRGRVKVPKAERPEHCELCESGRLLLIGEVCPVCESGPQPSVLPRTLQRDPKDCDHKQFTCWRCWVDDPTLRVPAYQDVFGCSPGSGEPGA